MILSAHNTFPRNLSPFAARYRDMLNTVAEQALRFQELEPAMRLAMVQADEASKLVLPPRTIYCQISNATLIPGWDWRWKYSVTEVEVFEDGTTSPSGGGFSGDGYNVRELAHVPATGARYIWGVDIQGASYPPGFKPRPVGGGGTDGTIKTPTVVSGYLTLLKQVSPPPIPPPPAPAIVFVFDAMGSHDGTCEAPPP